MKKNGDDIWLEIDKELHELPFSYHYEKEWLFERWPIQLILDADAGGGFEGAYSFTLFTTVVTGPLIMRDKVGKWKFALHDEKLFDKVGKLLGAEDVELGYSDFDKRLIIKTNEMEATKQLFADENLRKFFISLKKFSLTCIEHPEEEAKSRLDLHIERSITNTEELKNIYTVFISILNRLANLTLQ